MGVPDRQQLGRREDHQGIRSLQPGHGGTDRRLNRGLRQPRLSDQIGDYLCVAGGVENGSLEFQFPAKRIGVDEIPVVSQSHGALDVVDHQRLGVAPVSSSGGAVANVSYGHLSLPQGIQDRR